MKMRTETARDLRDALYAREAAIEAELAHAREFVAHMQRARGELGLTGTLGDAAIARGADMVTALEQAKADLATAHEELYVVLKATNIRGVAVNPKHGNPVGEYAQRA